MNLLMTKPGAIVNLDQTRLIEVLSDRFLFHFIDGSDHKAQKKPLPEGEVELIDNAIRPAIPYL